MKRSGFLVVGLILAGCGTKEKSTTKPAPPEALALVRQSDRAFARFGEPRIGLSGLEVHVPSRSDLPLSVRAHGDEARGLSIKPLDVAQVTGHAVESAMLFAEVATATDLLYAHDGDRFEEVRVLREPRAPSTFRWEIEAGRSIVDLRVREGRIEGIDAHGRVMVQAGEPFAVDHAGKRRMLAVAIAKKGERFVVTASLDTRGLSFPVVVDPVWIGGPTMSSANAGHTAAIDTTGTVWLGCGSYGYTFDKYDPTTDTITKLPDPSSPPSTCAITFVSGKVVVAGGGSAMSFDKTTSTWSAGASATNTNNNSFVVGLADGKILLMGGGLTSSSSSVEVYDPTANTWTAKASLLVARESAMAVRLASGKVLVAGGQDSGGPLSSAEIYDPATNTWTATGSMSAPRYQAGFARLPSGKVLFAGGQSPVDKTTVVFDPTSNTFTNGPALVATRTLPAVAATADGRVYVFGGSVAGEVFLNSVEVIDAALSASTAAPSMFVAREHATATLLLDQRILVAGGKGPMFSPTASTELFSSFGNGTACSWGGECASGTCVDGVCCATTCGTCLRCDVAGKEGTCNAASATTGCGTGPTCTGSTVAPRGHCSGTDGTCVAAASSACAGGLVCADASSCRASCTADADCTTAHCDTTTGLCLPPVPDAGPETAADTEVPDTEVPDTAIEDTTTATDTPAAAPVPEGPPKLLGSAKACTSPSDCDTGFCVDGVCCDTACKEQCHSCALPGSPGRCSEEPLGVDLRSECGPALSCSRTCGKGGACTTSTKGTQCAPSQCTGPSTGKGAAYCVANGEPCPVAEQIAFDCGAYVCDPAFGACRTSCTSSDNCASGFVCDPVQKSCVALPAEDSGGCAIATPGLARSGGLAALALLGLARLARRRSLRG